MIMNLRSLPILLPTVGLTGFIVGCTTAVLLFGGMNSRLGEIRDQVAAIKGAVLRTDDAAETARALEGCNKALQSPTKDLPLARDSFLVAARSSPGDREVFNTGVRIVSEALGTGHEDDRKIAADMRSVLQTMLAYLPFDYLSSARAELGKIVLVDNVDNSGDTPPASASETLAKQLERCRKIIDGGTPSDADPLVEEVKTRITSEKTLAMLDGDSESEKSLRALEANVAALEKFRDQQALKELENRYNRWQYLYSSIGEAAEKCAHESSCLGKHSGAFEKHAEDALAMLQEVRNYATLKVEGATQLVDRISASASRCRMAADWVYNQEALVTLKKIAYAPETTSARWPLLNRIERTRLNSIVAARFDQELSFLVNKVMKGDLTPEVIEIFGKVELEDTAGKIEVKSAPAK